MHFTNQHIQKSATTVDFFHARFILEQSGTEALTPAEKKLLQSRGVDLAQYKGKRTPVEESYLFGKAESSVRNKKGFNRLDLKGFRKFIDENPELFKLTKEDRTALKLARQSFANDIRRLAGDIKSDLHQTLIDVSQTATTKKQILKQVSSKLAENTKRYSGRMELISGYRLHETFQQGISNEILQRLGENARVYYSVHKDACEHCVKVYLRNGRGSQPRIFLLKTVIKNGNNIGRKAKEYKASIAPIHPHSITDKRTNVFTSKGWKQINDINVGDEVLTHRGRFRKVLSVLKNYDPGKDYRKQNNIFRIYFHIDTKRDSNQLKSLSLTGDHKVLTQRGWVMVKDLDINKDKIFKLIKPCSNPACNKYVDCHYDGRECCSPECFTARRSILANEQWKTGNLGGEEFRNKISETVTKLWRETNTYEKVLEFNKSEAIRKKHSDRLLNGMSQIMLEKSSRTRISRQQKCLYKKVLQLYLGAKLEYKIFNKSLDIAIPDLKIDIEFDGYFHKFRKESDEKRDQQLYDNGWHVLRYSKLPTLKQLKSDIERVSLNHKSLYLLQQIKIKRIQKLKVSEKTRLYDIEVDQDKSFVARGVVIHNCRCKMNLLPKGKVIFSNKQNHYIRVFD